MTAISSELGELVLAPEMGGCVSAFRWNGVDVLRPFDPRKGSGAPATDYAAFPLFPFSGRIANGAFSLDGKDHRLVPNFPPEPHAIHGQGWQGVWQVGHESAGTITLFYRHDTADWPWSYEARQSFTLLEEGLRVDLHLTNLSAQPMPGGIGWHPYFQASGARFATDVSAVWLSGEDMIPGAPSPLTDATDLRSERPVAALALDNAFAAGPGGSRLSWETKQIRLHMTASETLRHLIVFTPVGEDFFCVEPVSHSPDAVNSQQPAKVTGLKILQPNETLAGTIELRIER